MPKTVETVVMLDSLVENTQYAKVESNCCIHNVEELKTKVDIITENVIKDDDNQFKIEKTQNGNITDEDMEIKNLEYSIINQEVHIDTFKEPIDYIEDSVVDNQGKENEKSTEIVINENSIKMDALEALKNLESVNKLQNESVCFNFISIYTCNPN